MMYHLSAVSTSPEHSFMPEEYKKLIRRLLYEICDQQSEELKEVET